MMDFLEILKLFKAVRVGTGEADTERSKKLEQLENNYNNVRNLFMIYVNLLSMCNTVGHALITNREIKVILNLAVVS
ncbi:hypothetical protein MtrunA17_Chr1g0205841 [Medicago truncatula]|uniref:Uncharacterized protein n=1 Tax=Medicago truncatula TaxID=3880 RepID=A0A396JXQ6_MEDTR|nr:hypothetical protein MtrunA17_Chr1g0205841 [Medicago truncatula]